MNKAEFTDLIKNPDKLGSEHIETLKKIVTDYPYFSTAHILLAKALLNTNHYEYEKQLKHTALIVGDRSVLHQFLYNNNLDLSNEQEPFNVPIELKVEKVSKPDFEIGKEEQDALLSEAQQILGINENNSDEVTTEEFVNETKNDLFLETNLSITENIEPEVVPEVLNNNLVETNLLQENQPTSIENITENAIESNEEQLENILHNSEIEQEQTTITSLDVESSKNIDLNFQLTETEGTLIRFTLEDNFLPDFDEASLFIDEQNIETITKSVLPQTANSSEELTEEKNSTINLTNGIIELNAIENNELKFKPTELTIGNLEEQLSTFDNINNNITEPEITIDSIDVENSNKITATDNNGSIQTELNIENSEEQILTFDNLNITDNNTEQEVNDNLFESLNSHEITVTDNNDSIQTELNIENSEEQILTFDNLNITDNNTEQEVNDNLFESLNIREDIEILGTNNNNLTELNSISENEIESHNFIDWLTKNKSDDTNLLVELPINNTPEIINYEDVEFTEKIIQILKTKAEFNLNKNINHELTLANELSVVNDKKTETNDLVTTDKEEIVEPIEMPNLSAVHLNAETNESEITLVTSNEDEVYEEIESFSTQFVSLENKEVNETQNDISLSSLSETFIPEIYTGEVPSILPDFEALNKIDEIEEELTKPETFIKYDKKEGLIPDYNIPVFEPKLTPEIEVENEEELVEATEEVIPVFNSAPINDSDFEVVFSNAFEPLPPKIEVKEIVENKLQETENTNNAKQDVESILDKFMRENPSITRPKSEFFNPANVAKLSVEEKDEIVSETLASIYLKQGLIKKAILTYEKLSLIYPHKITYFAALINKIKTEHNIN